jgi:hypothetical protein
MPLATAPLAPASVREDDTRALQAQINRESARGGGVVVVPPGRHVCGTLELKSRVRLHLEHGARIEGATDLDLYPLWENPPVRCRTDANGFRSLIRADRAEHVSLGGSGVIDGKGAAFKHGGDDRDGRPRLIQMIGCRDVAVENLHLRDSGLWLQHYLGCERLRIHGLTAYNHVQPNNDFVDIEGCRDVRISDCSSDTDDDGITLKSGCAAPTEDVVITNCVIRSHCNSIKLGTESNGGFRNIVVSNCVVAPSRHPSHLHGFPGGICGVALEIVDGGTLDGVIVSHLRIDGPKIPLFIRLGDRARPFLDGQARPPVGRLRNIRVSHLDGVHHSTHGCVFAGLPGHPLENISLTDCRFEFVGGCQTSPDPARVPEKAADYPEATMFGEAPAFGLFIRHAVGVRLERVDLVCRQPDARPALVLEDALLAR